jgi:hypothetical protein
MTTATTMTRTAAVTMTDVRDVMWHLRTDLRTLRVMHQMITEAKEGEHVADLTQWVYRGYAQEIQFWFMEANGAPRYGTTYSVNRQWSGQPGQEAGGLQYVNLQGTTFNVHVVTTPAWRALNSAQRDAFYQTLQGTWGPAAAVRTSGGSWTQDRVFASGALAASRSVYRAS